METTKSFYSASCDGEALDLTGSRVFFEDLSDDMDGVFPRVNEWTRFANKIDRDGISEWFEKQAPHYDGIEKIEQVKYGRYKIYTKEVQGFFGQIGEKQIIETINGIEADVSYEWYNSRNGRQDKIANGISIFFENVKAF